MNFPECIQKVITDLLYEKNEVGMSQSSVFVFESYVLKVQQATPETENEYRILKWLSGKIPAPAILEYAVQDGMAYTLMTKAAGKMLCDEELMRNPERLVRLIAQALKTLWSVDVSNCPYTFSRLSERLKAARENIIKGEVDLDNAEPETFGQNGFANPWELLRWLEQNQPEEDLVLTHGDLCLPNVFADGEQVTAFIDNGKMGPADRWQDLAIVLRSLRHNFDGKYTGGVPYKGYDDNMLLAKLGMKLDEKKYRYYLLLDELF